MTFPGRSIATPGPGNPGVVRDRDGRDGAPEVSLRSLPREMADRRSFLAVLLGPSRGTRSRCLGRTQRGPRPGRPVLARTRRARPENSSRDFPAVSSPEISGRFPRTSAYLPPGHPTRARKIKRARRRVILSDGSKRAPPFYGSTRAARSQEPHLALRGTIPPLPSTAERLKHPLKAPIAEPLRASVLGPELPVSRGGLFSSTRDCSIHFRFLEPARHQDDEELRLRLMAAVVYFTALVFKP
jgi:hypothetical protein